MKVTALVVSHNGARWLPAVLQALAGQSLRPDRVVAVDTGSTDASPTLLREALDGHHGAAAVLDLPPDTGFPAAVAAALEALRSTGGDGADEATEEWLWLLHDDSRPAPDALERLVDAARRDPGLAVLGPKLREWPSLRRLLEVGVTISGNGRRETGLERGEYDQGQHDAARDVLAVNTAGMLVRREVLERLGGFDPALPVLGADLDLGWRAARAGHRVRVVPDAVVFHAEAAHRGTRPDGLVRSPRRADRRAAIYTLLVNCAGRAVPLVALRLLAAGLLRALGLLLVRAPRESLDEVVALGSVLLRPDLVGRGRTRRRRTATRPPGEVRHLLAPFWLPYRHGLDFVSDLGTAIAHHAADTSTTRRQRRPLVETGPIPPEAQSLPADTGLLARAVASPAVWVLVGLTVLSLVAARDHLGGGVLSGGALLPPPGSAGQWWALYTASVHAGAGWSDVAAGAYVAPLALLGTLLLGHAWLAVDVLFLLTAPLAAWGAARFLRLLVGESPARWWGAAAYALLPVVSGAVAQGRLGTVVAAVVLPWVAHAALFLRPGLDPDRRWRAAWRTALLLAVLCAFVPVAWPAAAVLAVAGAGARLAGWGGPRGPRGARPWLPVLTPLLAVPVLLLPWSLQGGWRDGGRPWFAEAGLAASDLVTDLGPWHLAAGRAADEATGAAPAWFGLLLTVAALAALLRAGTRQAVTSCWVVVVVGLATAVLLEAAGVWAGFPVLLSHAAAVTAATVAGAGIRRELSGRSPGWRQVVGTAAVVAALVSTAAGAAWWVLGGIPAPLERGPADDIPRYMTDATARDPDQGILVVEATTPEDAALSYAVVRDEGVRLGDDTVGTDDRAARRVEQAVAGLATEPDPAQVATLSRQGVEFVYLPPPAPARLAGNLDTVAGLSSASAPLPGSRAWQVDADPQMPPSPEPGPWHRLLLVVQVLAVVACLVLAPPSRRSRR